MSRGGPLAGTPVGIVGAGLMGGGIARVFAAAGAEVRVHDPDPARPAALAEVEGIDGVGSLAAAATGAALVIEAAPEDLGLKREIFAALDAAAPPTAILATNSSAIATGEIGAATRRPERVLGTHWWNPPDLVDLVEVIEAEATAAATVTRTMAVLRAVGKVPVHVRRDLPGFVGNRLQHSLRREAFALLDAGACDPEDIDLLCREALGPELAAHGLVESARRRGAATLRAEAEAIWPSLESSGEPARGLRERVARGDLGLKTGRGYGVWDDARADAVRARIAAGTRGDPPSTSTRLSA